MTEQLHSQNIHAVTFVCKKIETTLSCLLWASHGEVAHLFWQTFKFIKLNSMIALLSIVIAAYLCDLILSSVASGLSLTFIGVSIMPALISYSVYYHRPICSVLSAFFFGTMSDLLSGTHLGLHVISFLILWFICACAASFIQRARGILLWIHMAINSLLFHAISAMLFSMYGYTTLGSLGFIQAVMAALCQASIGLWLARGVHELLEQTGQRHVLSEMLFLGKP